MSSYGLWLSAAGMKMNDHRQALLANNMANADTTGFKHDLAVVTQREVESRVLAGGMQFAHPILDDMTGGINVRPTYHSAEQGPVEPTGRPLDVAIDGEGFFTVSDGNVTRYTRDGEFARSMDGELVVAAGEGRWKVLSDGGAPIVLTEQGGDVKISADGTVRQGAVVVGRLGLVTMDDQQSFRKVGENLFEAAADEVIPVEAKLFPEARERSTFDVMQGLATMIEATRAYQLNAKMIQLQDDTMGQAVSRIARVA